PPPPAFLRDRAPERQAAGDRREAATRGGYVWRSRAVHSTSGVREPVTEEARLLLPEAITEGIQQVVGQRKLFERSHPEHVDVRVSIGLTRASVVGIVRWHQKVDVLPPLGRHAIWRRLVAGIHRD